MHVTTLTITPTQVSTNVLNDRVGNKARQWSGLGQILTIYYYKFVFCNVYYIKAISKTFNIERPFQPDWRRWEQA